MKWETMQPVKQARAIQTRERLIEAAAQLLAKNGTAAATFDAIAETSGLSRGCIRFHFGSKQGLLLAVVEHMFADYEEFIASQLIGDGGRPSTVRQVLESQREFTERHELVGRLFFVLLSDALGPNEELLPQFVDLFRRLRKLAIEWVEAAKAAGSITPDVDPYAIASIVLGVFGGLRYHWHVDPEEVDLQRIYSALETVLINGLAPPGQRRPSD